VHQDGLVHISQLSDTFVKDPREVVSAGQRVTVRVLEVNSDKKQIALTMKSSQESVASVRPSANSGRGSEGMRGFGGGSRVQSENRGRGARVEEQVRVANTPFAALLGRK
jgi:uncharacterized protein